jgi:hypothetical protein
VHVADRSVAMVALAVPCALSGNGHLTAFADRLAPKCLTCDDEMVDHHQTAGART